MHKNLKLIEKWDKTQEMLYFYLIFLIIYLFLYIFSMNHIQKTQMINPYIFLDC